MKTMTDPRPPRLLMVDPNLCSLHGHYYGYAARIADAARGLGVEPYIAANRSAHLHGASWVEPTFSHNYWEEMRPAPNADPCDHIVTRATQFAIELSDTMQRLGLGEGDVLFLSYVNLVETLGLAQVASRMGAAFPRAALLFRRDLDEQGTDIGMGPRAGIVLLRHALAALLASDPAGRVRLFTDSDGLSEDYGERLARRFQTAPIPVDPQFTSLVSPPHVPTLVYLGDARQEKGYQHLPAVAAELADDLAQGRVRMVLQSNFNLPGGEAGIAAARAALAAHRNVTLLTDPLDEKTYVRVLHEASLVLLPYDASRYVARTSGVLAEAIHAGVPLVVPEETWMADQLRRHGAGVAYDPSAAGALPSAVRRALARLPELSRRAHARRAAFTAFHNPERLARFACGAAVLERARQRAA